MKEATVDTYMSFGCNTPYHVMLCYDDPEVATRLVRLHGMHYCTTTGRCAAEGLQSDYLCRYDTVAWTAWRERERERERK